MIYSFVSCGILSDFACGSKQTKENKSKQNHLLLAKSDVLDRYYQTFTNLLLRGAHLQ